MLEFAITDPKATRDFEHPSLLTLPPGAQSGTKWETETLKTLGLLQKAVFIMPPSSEDFDVGRL
jgi:hypothetical protein